jgi:hypothetical protein
VLLPPKLGECNRRLFAPCRRLCKDPTIASDFCRACRSFQGPCGIHLPTVAECCAEGVAVYTRSAASPTPVCACPAPACTP